MDLINQSFGLQFKPYVEWDDGMFWPARPGYLNAVRIIDLDTNLGEWLRFLWRAMRIVSPNRCDDCSEFEALFRYCVQQILITRSLPITLSS